jgi:kumamolisin
MRRKIFAGVVVVLAVSNLGYAQVRRGNGIVPESSIERPEDFGIRMHTNYLIFAPEGTVKLSARPGGETPASLGCIYGLVSNPVTGCPIATTTEVPTGGSGVIVIVDAYDYPSAAKDLTTFSTEFGLPAPNFVVAYATGKKPADACSSGWEVEESLDIEWAHAMSPNAQIVLMEAASNDNSSLYAAIVSANYYIASHGGKGEISMSWGGAEITGENVGDHYFTQSGVVYFAAAGDSPGVIYPGSSVNVVSAGGTQVNRTNGNYTSQTAWTDGGGGVSKYETRPSFQAGVANVVGSKRGTPDLSFDSSGNSPVAVYNSACYNGWLQAYGTSLAAPALAGIINNTGTFHASTSAELTAIYNNRNNSADFTDITSGNCGTNGATVGYDLCTGVGVDQGLFGK